MNYLTFCKVTLPVLAVIFSLPVCAQTNTTEMAENEFGAIQAVDNADLDEMRGGFIDSNGFKFDIGITKTVAIDGVVHIESSFAASSIYFNGTTVKVSDVQSIGALRTIIQNVMDNRTIKSEVGVDLTLNGGMALISNLQQNRTISAIQDMQVLR